MSGSSARGDEMTIQEAVQRMDKSEATIRRWIKQNKLESTLIDGRYEIGESALVRQRRILRSVSGDEFASLGRTRCPERG